MANEKRLIYANELWSDIMMLPHNGDMISSEEVEQAIKDADTVDAVEVVHGRWNIINFFSGDTAICSVCGCGMLVNEPGNGLRNVEDLHYCPNCGAKMDGDGNG